jgi:hypothetical protein
LTIHYLKCRNILTVKIPSLPILTHIKKIPSIRTPGYHIPQDTPGFEETFDFDLEHYILAGGVGGIPPSPPESPPYTPRNELEEDSEEEEEHKVNLKTTHSR